MLRASVPLWLIRDRFARFVPLKVRTKARSAALSFEPRVIRQPPLGERKFVGKRPRICGEQFGIFNPYVPGIEVGAGESVLKEDAPGPAAGGVIMLPFGGVARDGKKSAGTLPVSTIPTSCATCASVRFWRNRPMSASP